MVASRDEQIARKVQEIFLTDRFRVWTTIGATSIELGGALKKVIGITAGLYDGLGRGHDGRAALITRGVAEISRLGVAMGASPSTFVGMSGAGDRILTWTSDVRRNRRLRYQHRTEGERRTAW